MPSVLKGATSSCTEDRNETESGSPAVKIRDGNDNIILV